MRRLLALGPVAALAALAVLPATAPAPAPPVAYTLDKAHSEVTFRVRHMGISNVSGRFTDFDATIQFDPARLASLQTTATIQTASVTTNNERRDGHLKSADFFDVATHPTIRFVSRRVQGVQGPNFQLLGDLTMHGVTKPVLLRGTYLGATRDGQGNERIGFEATGTINREDFGMTWNRAVEAGGVLVSKEVQLTINVEASRPTAQS